MSLSKVEKRKKIKKRIRQHVYGSESRPRLSVFRSNKEIYAQIVDDVNGKTLAAAFRSRPSGGKRAGNAAWPSNGQSPSFANLRRRRGCGQACFAVIRDSLAELNHTFFEALRALNATCLSRKKD